MSPLAPRPLLAPYLYIHPFNGIATFPFLHFNELFFSQKERDRERGREGERERAIESFRTGLSMAVEAVPAAGGDAVAQKNRIQVSSTKKPLFFYINLAKVLSRMILLHVYLSFPDLPLSDWILVSEFF